MTVRINIGRLIWRAALLGVCLFLLHSCYDSCFSPEAKERQKQEKAARQAERDAEKVPRKISSAGENGCETWAFKPGERWIYSMRCPGTQTDTRNEWEVCRASGKTRTCTIEGTNVPAVSK